MCLFMLWCLGLQTALAQDRDYTRSMEVTGRGIVATSQVLASQAGAHILARRGSAIDPAIAASAVQGVTEPMMNGTGCDLFLLCWDAKSGKLYGLNASGWAPPGRTIDFLKKQGITSMTDDGIHSVTVPGAVDGWAKAHQRFERLPWRVLFTPAIYYAEHGYSVAEIIHDFWGISRAKLKQTDEARLGFGIMGGSNQPLAHAQFVSNVVDYSWNIQAALSAPRFTIRDTGEPIKCTIVLESRVLPEVQSQFAPEGP
jgi:gamma-glutamyltranspeptidase/glutathione hydrolase